MKLSELFLNRFLYKEPLQNLETKDSVYNSSNLNPAVAVPIASGGAATDIGTGNVPVGGDIGNVSTPAPDIVPIGLSVVETKVTVSTNGNVSAFVTLTWNEIISATFDHYQIRFKKSTYTYYQYIDSKTNTITIDNLSPNVLYNFGISSVNKYGTSSAFSTDISTTTATNSIPPATVTGLTTMAGIQYVIATWTSNTESDIASYNIYRHTANNSALAVLIGNSFTNYFIDGGLTGGTPYYYWIKAVNTSGILSTSFSTVSTATPRNIITNDIGAGQITPPLTNLPAINPVSGYLNENTVGTYELQDNAVYEANVLAGAISATKTNLAAINPVSGDLNLNTVGTLQLQDNAVGSQESNIALRGWTQTLVFTATDADTVTWTATAPNNNKFTASNGDSYTIVTGNTGNMTAKTYIYLCPAVSTTAYQYTTVATDAIGDGKVLIAIAQNNTTEATFTLLNNNSYNIDAANIVAGSITANEIAAGAVIASKITSFNFQISAGTFTNNSPTAGKISWAGVKVVYAGAEYAITDGNCLATDKHIYWQLASPTVFSASATLPALGNEDFLAVFNNGGTAVFVWNSTVINGNRITTGSITATNMAAHTITANEIAAGTITAVEIAAGTITANKIKTFNFQLTTGAFANNTPTAGKLSWTGCKVVYDGVEYSIADDDCLATDKHIYWQLAAPTVFSASANLPALGNDDFIVVFNNSGTALYVWNSTIINGNRITAGSITATNIAANTLTANEIAAGTITADRINSNSFAFSAITFTANSPTAGKVAWTGCKVVYKGTEYAITNGSCLATDQHIYWQLASPNVFSASATLPALGNDDFLVVYNDAGTPKYVWNSTIINGNRISTGSIYTGQIATGTITGTNIAGNTIASSNILSVNADKILIDGAVYLSNWRAGTELTKIDGGNLYVGSQITIGASAPAPLSGHIKSGQTDYNTGVGWWLGSVAGVAKFSIGNPADSYFTYDSGTGVMTLKGAITATTGAIGGWNINATSIYTGTEDHSGYTTYAGDMTLYSNGSAASIHANKFYIDSSGVLNCTAAVVSGAITTGVNSSLDAQYITNSTIINTLTMGSAVTIGYIKSYGWDGTANGFQLTGGTTPSLTVIGGTITGTVIQTSSSSNTGIKINNTSNVIDVWGETSMRFHDTGVSGYYGYLGATTSGISLINNNSARKLTLGSYGDIVIDAAAGFSVSPGRVFTDLGNSSYPWRTIWVKQLSFHTRNYVGSYDAGTTYYLHNRVLYSGDYWDYINASPTAGNTPSENAYWTAQLSPSPYNISEEITFDTDSSAAPTNFNFSSNIQLSSGHDYKGDYAHIDNIVVSDNSPLTEEGSIYFNTTDHHFYGYNGTSWVQLDN